MPHDEYVSFTKRKQKNCETSVLTTLPNTESFPPFKSFIDTDIYNFRPPAPGFLRPCDLFLAQGDSVETEVEFFEKNGVGA